MCNREEPKNIPVSLLVPPGQPNPIDDISDMLILFSYIKVSIKFIIVVIKF